MKTFDKRNMPLTGLILLLGLLSIGLAEETKTSAEVDAAPVVTEPKEADTSPLTPAPATDVGPSVSASSAAPAAVSAPIPAAKAETKIEPTAIVSTPTAKAPSAVPQLEAIVAFHEKEIASMKPFMDRWNKEIGGHLQQRHELETKISSMTATMADLKKANTKASKKQADQIKKEISNQNKELKNINENLRSQIKVLSGDVRAMSTDDQQAMKLTYERVLSEIQQIGK